MTPVRQDRRVRRTRAALRRAMVELVTEQGYEAITVDALVERADVTRATFYAHYASKNQLLTAVVDAFADEVEAAFGVDEVPAGDGHRLEVLLRLARASGDVVGLIVRGEGDGGPLRRFTERVEAVLRADLDRAQVRPGVDPDLLIRLRAAQVLAAVSWSLEHPDAVPAVVAATATRLGNEGWSWAVDPPARSAGPATSPAPQPQPVRP